MVGVAPYNLDTGKLRGRRIIKGGRERIREVLYMTAVCASQRNPILSAFYKKLRTREKSAKVALVAVIRMMVVLANRIVADPNFQPA